VIMKSAREHARDLQLVAGLEDAIGQPDWMPPEPAATNSATTRADQRQAAADAQAAEEKGSALGRRRYQNTWRREAP